MLHFGERGVVHHQHAGAHGGEILQRLPERSVGGELVISLDGIGRLGLRKLGGGAQARQRAIAGRSLGGDFVEGGFRLRVFAGFAQRRARTRMRRRRRRLSWPASIHSRARRRCGDDQDGERDDVDAVAFPQLLQPFAPDFLVHFIEKYRPRTAPTNARLMPVPGRMAA